MKTYEEAYETAILSRSINPNEARTAESAMKALEQSRNDFEQKYQVFSLVRGHEPSMAAVYGMSHLLLTSLVNKLSVPDPNFDDLMQEVMGAVSSQMAIGVAVGIEMEKIDPSELDGE